MAEHASKKICVCMTASQSEKIKGIASEYKMTVSWIMQRLILNMSKSEILDVCMRKPAT